MVIVGIQGAGLSAALPMGGRVSTSFTPVAAQAFQVWWYALNEEKLSPDADLGVMRTAFPDARQQPRAEQKPRLRRVIEKYRKNRELLADPATEVRSSAGNPMIAVDLLLR